MRPNQIGVIGSQTAIKSSVRVARETLLPVIGGFNATATENRHKQGIGVISLHARGGSTVTIDELICKMECQELILHHARCLDEGSLAESQSLFTEDATMIGPSGEKIRVADRNEAEMRRVTANLKPRILTNIVITPTGPNTAKAFSYITLPRPNLPQGEWHYELRKTDKGWRISHRMVVPIKREEPDRQ